MEVTDTKYLEQIEAQQERMAKREQRKNQKRGWLGRWVSFKSHIAGRSKKNVTAIEDRVGILGRAGNRVYIEINGDYVLYKKFKNSTKAKKFMKIMEATHETNKNNT